MLLQQVQYSNKMKLAKTLISLLLLISPSRVQLQKLNSSDPIAVTSGIDESFLDPCHLQNISVTSMAETRGKCDVVNSRVFSNRRQFRRFKVRHRRRSKKHRRDKRDRSLLALSGQRGPQYWPRWCNKVAFFRVFRQDFTLCLYSKRFKDDPIMAYSNPNIGTTVYGYKGKKYYQELARSSDLKYVSGYVLGHSFSGVQGYVWNHRFYGTIFVRNNVLFVEPIVSNNQIRFPYYVTSSRKMVRKKGSLNAYVYKILSRSMKKGSSMTSSFFAGRVLATTDKFYLRSRVSQSYSGSRTKRPKTCKTCSLILVADYEFYRDVGQGSVSKENMFHPSLLLPREPQIEFLISMHSFSHAKTALKLVSDMFLSGSPEGFFFYYDVVVVQSLFEQF